MQNKALCALYTEQNDKHNTFVFAPIFHELNSKIYIYIYAFCRRFYPKCIQAIHLLSVCVFPGNWTHELCAVNTMLCHWATQEHI